MPGRAAGRRGVPDPRAARVRYPVLRAAARSDVGRGTIRAWGRRRLRPADRRSLPWRRWIWLAVGVLPAIVVFFAYNQRPFRDARSSPATRWRRCRRSSKRSAQLGLFSLAHVPMNLDYFFVHLPMPIAEPSRSSGRTASGCPSSLTSPGLLFAVRADWRGRGAWLLAGAAGRRPRPDAALLRRWLAAVRLSLLPRLRPVRDRPVRAGGRPPRRCVVALADRSSCSASWSWPSASTGRTTLTIGIALVR